MKQCKKIILSAAALLLMLTGCSESDGKNSSNTLTIMTFQRNYEPLREALKEKYPDISLEIQSYKGRNSTVYIKTLLETGNAPDIVTAAYVLPDELQEQSLIDLSAHSFVTNYEMNILSGSDVNGGIYLLPSAYTISGIMYNKTLFEKHGWEAPQSFEELCGLVPEIKAAGVDLSACDTQYPGSGFSYLMDIAGTDFEGYQYSEKWRDGFMNGTANADHLRKTADYMQRWIDIGMLSMPSEPVTDSKTKQHFTDGNTAFLISANGFRFTRNEDGTGDRYGIIPWLSEDGTSNILITKVPRYYGLNKALENDPKKLENALRVMEFLSSEDGQLALLGGKNDAFVLPLRDYSSDFGSGYSDVFDLVRSGNMMPFVYDGWEDHIVGIGNSVYSMMEGRISPEQLITEINANRDKVLEAGGNEIYAEVSEDMSKEEVAHLMGAAFAEAVGADCSLVSVGEYHEGFKENPYGVNGCLFAGTKVDEQLLCTVNPLGWSDPIYTMEMTGAEVKELAGYGLDLHGDGNTFPYVLTVTDGVTLDDDTVYTAAVPIETEENMKKYSAVQTDVTGQDAAVEYIKHLGGTLSPECTVQSVGK